VIAEATPGRPPGAPVSRELLAADLRSLGLRRGQDLLIHCSLRQIGPVEGGATALLDALLDVAGRRATLVVPTYTTLNSLTSRDFHAAVAGLDGDQRARFVAAMPGFDPARTPSYQMGTFAEHLRTRPTAVRSHHPQASLAALGRQAQACTSTHDLDCQLGDRSPLGWLYAADAAILLLGVGYSVCTAFHLAEYHLPGPLPVQEYRCFTAEEGGRAERAFTAVALDDSDFAQLGDGLEATSPAALRQGPVGSGTGRLVPLRAAVDFAVTWLTIHRRRPPPEKPLSSCPYSRAVPIMVPVPWGGKGWRAIMAPRRGFLAPGITRRWA
jgi:aminoglycoside 3-N-acetyltransferase